MLKTSRKHHFFEHHIRKVLLEVCPERDITKQAKAQLNELLIITCKIIMSKAFSILFSTSKKTIGTTEIESAVKLVFTGQLAQKSTEEGKRCVQNFLMGDKLKGQSHNFKADILIPPSVLNKFMRLNITKGYRISYTAPLFLAGVIEYFLSQILDSANNLKVRITIFDIEYGIRMDTEINDFFVFNNIYLNIPCKYIFPKSVFENKFKNYISLVYPEIRYQKNCFSLFQDFIEKFIINILKHSNNITINSDRNKVMSKDIELALFNF